MAKTPCLGWSEPLLHGEKTYISQLFEICTCTKKKKPNRSLYGQVVCCVQVSCKANKVGNQLGAWRYSDLLAIVYLNL